MLENVIPTNLIRQTSAISCCEFKIHNESREQQESYLKKVRKIENLTPSALTLRNPHRSGWMVQREFPLPEGVKPAWPEASCEAVSGLAGSSWPQGGVSVTSMMSPAGESSFPSPSGGTTEAPAPPSPLSPTSSLNPDPPRSFLCLTGRCSLGGSCPPSSTFKPWNLYATEVASSLRFLDDLLFPFHLTCCHPSSLALASPEVFCFSCGTALAEGGPDFGCLWLAEAKLARQRRQVMKMWDPKDLHMLHQRALHSAWIWPITPQCKHTGLLFFTEIKTVKAPSLVENLNLYGISVSLSHPSLRITVKVRAKDMTCWPSLPPTFSKLISKTSSANVSSAQLTISSFGTLRGSQCTLRDTSSFPT